MSIVLIACNYALSGEHTGRVDFIAIPDVITLAGAPLACCVVKAGENVQLRIGEMYITLADYDRHPDQQLHCDRACISLDDLAELLTMLRDCGWVWSEISGHKLIAAWNRSGPILPDDLPVEASPWRVTLRKLLKNRART